MIHYLNSWYIHPDGKRFLMLKPAPASDDEFMAKKPRRINYIVNWFEELKDR